MYHFAPRSYRETSLWEDWEEGAALWARLVLHVRGPVAVCLMGTHVHVLHTRNVARELGVAMAGYTQWRNRRRGRRDRVWGRTTTPSEVTGDKVFRNIRYIALNPCRARMVDDPLAWPFSSHRDAVGLAVPPVRRRASDPHEHHRRVSADPAVAVDGTLLPAGCREPRLDEVLAAVSALTRTPLAGLPSSRAPCRLFLCAARALTSATNAEIAATVDVHPRTVQRAASSLEPAVEIVARVAGDPRFAALAGPLPRRFR